MPETFTDRALPLSRSAALIPAQRWCLIDGHRVVSHPSGTNSGLDFFVDLNTIPQAAIESMEILKDGASTTYGADAVAGVVNIKLRHNYQGAEAYAEYGNSTDTDSGETAASILFGVGDNNTNLTGVATYYSRNSIFSRDRDYDRRTSLPNSIGATTYSEPYNLELSRAAVVAAGGNPPPELGDTFFGHAPFFSNGTAPASSYVYYAKAHQQLIFQSTILRANCRTPSDTAHSSLPITKYSVTRWWRTATCFSSETTCVTS